MQHYIRQHTKSLVLIAILLIAAAFKAWLIMGDALPFNADEAIVALMARHINFGARPVFFYGQAYLGSLDAWLIAIGFRLFGEAVWVIRSVQTILYLGTIFTTYLLALRVFRSETAGWGAALLLALPPVNTTLYTTATLGGYGEAMLIGNLILLTSLRIAENSGRNHTSPRVWFGWGAVLGGLIGLGGWTFGLTLVYALPALMGVGFVWWRGRRPFWFLAGIILGGVAGAFPLIAYTLDNGIPIVLAELLRGGVGGVSGGSFLGQMGRHILSFLLFGLTALFGLRPPWAVIWLALPAIPFVLFVWGGVLRRAWSQGWVKGRERLSRNLLYGVGLTLIAAFILSPFGADPSGRYFLPLYVVLALFAGDWAAHSAWDRRYIAAAVVLLVGFHVVGTVQVVRQNPPGITTQFDAVAQVDHRYMEELMTFLRGKGISRGYTNYWVAYPLAFQSKETLIFVPALPYHQDFRHTTRDNRYPPYNDLVRDADELAYITTHHPALNRYLREQFSSLGITWLETNIGDYQVFYALNRPIHPEEIGLGVDSGAWEIIP